MEIILLLIVAALACAAICLLWKCRDLKRGIYDFSRRLDGTLNRMMDGKRLEAEPYEKDDLWGMIYERLLRLSDMYIHKEKEITEEKETLKELVSDISHQTKTPLANIRLYLERLESGERDDALLTKMDAQVGKLDFLLASMVKISRLETGAITIRKTRTPIAPTLAEALAAVVPQAENKHIRLSAEVDDALVLEHDPKWTAEAVYNLLDNAVKYTAEGGAVSVRVERGPVFTQIAVRDNGKGIARERQGAIFARFYREPEVHDSEGAGLGLYLTRGIIERQGGFVEVSSEPERGSVFTINLPN